MSTTYTLPMSATDSCTHGYSHSRTGSQQHNRTSNRLAPPFSLPRIPSGSVATVHNHNRNHDHDHHHEHEHSHIHDEQKHKHSYSHTKNSAESSRLIPAPIIDASGNQTIGKRRNSTQMSEHTPILRIAPRNVSKPTEFLLQSTQQYSLLHGILADPESRRISYFMLLNLAFMLVQSTYGYLTGSLGLISDSIHMFFDCVALLVGLCAAVMSKWPPSVKFPYGYGKLDTLAGLGNGIFLMLISIEIIYEATERLVSGANVERTTELLIVSSIGLVVNLVGIMAFHGHHGHNHLHSHEHNDDHHHHIHNEQHDHHHQLSQSPSNDLRSASSSPIKTKKAAHGHHHASENMEGIYLHIMADALGSVAVVISTLLIQFTGWSGFDPLASCIIAVLIFLSTIPLIRTTTKILLLSLNSDIEYNLRDILAGVSSIRGVVGYAVPKFWLEDVKKEPGEHHGHSHGHSHGHDHNHHTRKNSTDSHSSCDDSNNPAVLGVMHVIASQNADLEDVKARVSEYLHARKMHILIQMEREGEGRCWCGGGLKAG